MAGTRIEKDSFGTIEVPADRLWGAQTERSRRFFRISGERIPLGVVHALARVKKAAAAVNAALGLLEARKAQASEQAADEVLASRHDDEFPLVVWQTGSGTQSNMNVNEVLANRASELLGGERGQKRLVHPNDDVNMGQSSNDVFPTAMHVAASLFLHEQLLPAVDALKGTLAAKRDAFAMPSITSVPGSSSVASAFAGTRQLTRTRRRSQRFERMRRPMRPPAISARFGAIRSAMPLTRFAPIASRQST